MKSRNKRYVVGFLFSEDEQNVALLRKDSPEWQAGKLNGMGGHVEEGESFDDAMAREGYEESGQRPIWEVFAVLEGEDWTMHCYKATDNDAWLDISAFNDVGEKFEYCPVHAVAAGKLITIPNLKWLIPMALSESRYELKRVL